MVSLSLALAYSVATLAAETGSREYAIASVQSFETGAFEGDTGKPVLRNIEAGTRRAHLPAQISHFRDRQSVMARDHNQGRVLHALI